MLDLHRLRLLQEFAARGSIAKTAAVLGYTPSAVSQQLATPPVLSQFGGVNTIVSLVARGIAIVPRLAAAAGERRVAVRDLPHGLDLARDVHAVARTASVRRPSVTVIVTALRAPAQARPAHGIRPRPTLSADPLTWPRVQLPGQASRLAGWISTWTWTGRR